MPIPGTILGPKRNETPFPRPLAIWDTAVAVVLWSAGNQAAERAAGAAITMIPATKSVSLTWSLNEFLIVMSK